MVARHAFSGKHDYGQGTDRSQKCDHFRTARRLRADPESRDSQVRNCAPWFAASAAPRKDGWKMSSVGALKAGRLLGAAGRAWAAHIVQFGPVRVESPGEELAEEVADSGEGICPCLVVGDRGGNGCRIDDRHDESCLFSGVF
jgi:hypothetical protein